MSQYEQDNDLGGGGGEADDETTDDAWETRAEAGAEGSLDETGDELDALDKPDPGEPWAKTSSGDEDDV
jgi:hypothetical protein